MKTPAKLWREMPIRGKMRLVYVILLLVVFLAAGLNIGIQLGEVQDIGASLADLSDCETLQNCMEQEKEAFQNYIRSGSEKNRERYEKACLSSREALDALPVSAAGIGAERFAKIRNIRNAYQNYETERNEIAVQDLDESGSVQQLYRVYDMQNYILSYISSLISLTVAAGSSNYLEKLPRMHAFTIVMWAVAALMGVVVVIITGFMTKHIVEPVTKLSDSAEQIASGDFSGKDVTVSNRDEIGMLVTAFNRMKHATQKSIQILEENQMLSEKVHRDELEKAQMEKQLEDARLDLLQSQIQPHFLFNTLNTIAGMAELEEAPTTAEMTKSLSNIFRYNLHTTQQFVSLTQELSVSKDYLYLQKIRFGSRLNFDFVIQDGLDTDRIFVPAFTLQPLVENAVIHGVTKKEEGGSVRLEVRGENDEVTIAVRDTGVGIPEEKLAAIQTALTREADGKGLGVGLGNVCRRIHSYYPEGGMKMESGPQGTEALIILKGNRKGEDSKDDQNSDRG